MNGFMPDPESLGRRRFPDNKSYRKDLYNRASILISSLLDLLPSNYPQNTNTDTAILFRSLAREFARQRQDISYTDSDRVYTQTRIEFLQQILGERLFLYDRLAPANYNDESFRDYLITLKDAYLRGSLKSNMEDTASKFTGLPINITELYQEARKPGSSYDISDTHMITVQLMVDQILSTGKSINQILADLDFFINLIKPAHVLYDTGLIWTEQIDVNKVHDIIYGDTGGGCIPVYDLSPWQDQIVYAHHVTIVTGPQNATGRIDSVHEADNLFFLTDQTRVLTDPNATIFYDANGRRIDISDLRIGMYVRLGYMVISGDWKFWWVPNITGISDWARFYPSTYKRPAFQENVKKVMDSQGRFPLQVKTTPTTICDRWVQDLLNPLYEDIRRPCIGRGDSSRSYSVTLADRMWYPKLFLPYNPSEVSDTSLYGDDFLYTMPNTPLTDGSSSPAGISDVMVYRDGTFLPGVVTSVDSSSGSVSITDSTSYWDTTGGGYLTAGTELTFGYKYLLDGTNHDVTSSFGYGISYWQMPSVPIVKPDGSGDLANIDDIDVMVDGTSITGAVSDIRSLFGHIILKNSSDFWNGSELGRLPDVGDQIDFDFFKGTGQLYAMLFDDPERVMDYYPGANAPYGLVFDGAVGDGTSSSTPLIPLEIGYRYRSYLLHHSSVWNSPDTLKLNNYQKPVFRASLANKQDSLNHRNLFFSGEFLDDTSSPIILNDQYLENGLDPVLKLNEGTPTFQETFSFHPDLIYSNKLQDIREHHNLLLYSDLLLKEFETSGASVPLSSICDSENYTFKIRFSEELDPIEECDPWILFDTVDTTNVTITIPGTVGSIPNVRVDGQTLRDTLILRAYGYAGYADTTYTTITPSDSTQTVFQLPETIQYESPEYGWINFPSLPVMKDNTNLADVDDVTVTVNGDPATVKSVDPVTGVVEIYAFPDEVVFENRTLTSTEIGKGFLDLGYVPLNNNIAMNIIHGPSQYQDEDFYILGTRLFWLSGPLDGKLSAGDVVRVGYLTNKLLNATVSISYRIQNSRSVDVIDSEYSRIMDYKYVFGGACPDPVVMEVGLLYNEYANFLDDYSEGIRLRFLNKDTYQVEDHVFSGPVFEIYDASEDEIGSPESFPNALVRVPNPWVAENPLESLPDYGFLNDDMVRFRKKTYKELLPDRSFRVFEIMEMMSI